MRQKDSNRTSSSRNSTKRKYIFHKKLFNIKESKTLTLFEKLMEGQFVECSYKLSSGKIYPVRFNLFFPQKENKTAFEKTINFFKELSKEQTINLNYSILTSLFKKSFDLNKVQRILLGVDFREKLKESRVKIYFIISNYPSKTEEILKINGKNKEILSLINKDLLLFGIDFSFDGKTQIKIYPHINFKELNEDIFLKKHFKSIFKKRKNLFKNTHHTYISFKTPNFDKIIYFKPINQQKFIESLNNKIIKKYSDTTLKENFKCGYISISEKELKKEDISNFTFYY